MNQTLVTTTISWKPTVEARKKPMTAVMQLLNFILVERRQDDGSIKFHAHEDFSRFLKMEKEQIINADLNGSTRTAVGSGFTLSERRVKELAHEYYNETYNK